MENGHGEPHLKLRDDDEELEDEARPEGFENALEFEGDDEQLYEQLYDQLDEELEEQQDEELEEQQGEELEEQQGEELEEQQDEELEEQQDEVLEEQQDEELEEQQDEVLEEQQDEELEEQQDEELEEEPPRSETPVVMPSSSRAEAAGQHCVYIGPPLLQDSSSDELDCDDDVGNIDVGSVDHGEEGDGDASSDDSQPRELTVTYRCEVTNQEIPTATLIRKRLDSVDKFLPFVAGMLRSMQSEQLKKKVMDDISKILIDGKTEEIQEIRQSRLQ